MKPALILTALGSAIATAASAGEPEALPRALEELVASFGDRYKVERSNEPLPKDKVLSPGLAGVQVFRFKARSALPRSRPPTYLRFQIRVLEYADPPRAAEALARTSAEVLSDEQRELHKSPLLLCVSGARLLRLEGSCLYSAPRWREIEDPFARLCSGAELDHRLRIECGGAVTERPTAGRTGGAAP